MVEKADTEPAGPAWNTEVAGMSKKHMEELQRLVEAWASTYEASVRASAQRAIERERIALQQSQRLAQKEQPSSQPTTCEECPGVLPDNAPARDEQPTGATVMQERNGVDVQQGCDEISASAITNDVKYRYGSGGRASGDTLAVSEAGSHFTAMEFARRGSSMYFGGDQVPIAPWTKRLRDMITSPLFENSVSILIMASVVLITVEVQYTATTQEASPFVFDVFSAILSFIFLIELLLRIFASGFSFFFARQWRGGVVWNWFDTVFVISGFVEFAYMVLGMTGASSSVVGALRIARLLRIARMLRIARVVRSSTVFEELRVLLYAILSAGGAIMWSMSILFSVLFIAACIITQGATTYFIMTGPDSSQWACEKTHYFFGSVPKSLTTLFLSVTGGVNWGEPLDCISSVHSMYGVVFFFAVAFCLIAIMNIVNGFFVETSMQAAKADREHKVSQLAKDKQKYIDELRRVFHLMDTDGNAGLTREEFTECVESTEFQDYLAAFDLDIEAGKEIFALLDTDGDGAVDFDEFIQGCMRFRGQATAMDVASLRQDMKRLSRRVMALLSEHGPMGALFSVESNHGVLGPPPQGPRRFCVDMAPANGGEVHMVNV